MKRTLSVILLLALLLLALSACQVRRDPSPESSLILESSLPPEDSSAPYEEPGELSVFLPLNERDGAIELGGLRWGMTLEEIAAALDVPLDQLPYGSELAALSPKWEAEFSREESEETPCYYLVPKAEAAGSPAHAVVFLLQKLPLPDGGDREPLLYEIRVLYHMENGEPTRGLQQEFTRLRGNPLDERLIVEAGSAESQPAVGIKRVKLGDPEIRLWYSSGTWTSALTPGASDWLRRNTLGTKTLSEPLSKEESTKVWQDDDNWKVKTDYSFLTQVTLNSSMDNDFNFQSIPLDTSGPYVVLSLNGTNACYANVLRELYPE